MVHTCNIRHSLSVSFRSYKNLDEHDFNKDLNDAPFHVGMIFDDIDDNYWFYEKLFSDTLQEHAPVKQKRPRKEPPPYMNSNYRKLVYKTRQAHNKYMKNKSKENWEQFRCLRNLKTKVKRESIQTYFNERCGGGPKSKDFWPTIKPFLSSKSTNKSSNNIILKENDNLHVVSDQTSVCELLNTFYVNIAKNIGIDSSTSNCEKHPSIVKIESQMESLPDFNSNFNFKHVTPNTVEKLLTESNPKKATGCDNIPPKILKCAASSICHPLTTIINKMIDTNKFPSELKRAQVTPIFKKDDPFIMKNYRPVSILNSTSKIFEKILNKQLLDHFSNIFHDFLSAFRPGYGCQTTLLRLVEDWKAAMDDNKHVAAILMDLSKAFDCLPHDLLVLKLRAYGLSGEACSLVFNYLTERQQMVKIGTNHSQWLETLKGVPQGSILGPLIFNIFMNDIFYFIHKSSLYNYADDNTLSFVHQDPEILKRTLEDDSKILIDWFQTNQMQANPDKFQAIAIGNKSRDFINDFKIDNVTIKCEESVKLLGVDIDFLLNFDLQISRMCKKAAGQLNVLYRISKFLSTDCKILIYKSFIRSNFNYCPLVWHFCNKTNTEKLEKLQLRALRIVFNDFNSSYSDLLIKADMPTLHLSCIRNIATETFKCLHQLNPSYLHDLVRYRNSSYSFRYTGLLDVPPVRTTTYGKRSFMFEATQVWNSLPNHIRQVENYKEFGRLIRTSSGPACKCSMCC